MRTFKVVLQSLSVAVMLLFSVTVVHAATIEFFGSRDSFNGATSVPNPSRCGVPAPPNLFVTVPTGPGVSNLGAFVHHDTHCINVATGNVFDGLFEWDFGSGNTMLGTFLGNIILPATNGVTTFIEMFTLTGGAGVFKDATGSFLGTGFVYFRQIGRAHV